MKPVPHLHLDFPIPDFFRDPKRRYVVAAIGTAGAIFSGLNVYDYFYRPDSGAGVLSTVMSSLVFTICALAVIASTVGRRQYRSPALDLDASGVLWTRGYPKPRRFLASEIQDMELSPGQLTLKLRSGKRVPITLEGLGRESHRKLQRWIGAYWPKVKRRSSKGHAA